MVDFQVSTFPNNNSKEENKMGEGAFKLTYYSIDISLPSEKTVSFRMSSSHPLLNSLRSWASDPRAYIFWTEEPVQCSSVASENLIVTQKQ